MKRLKRLGAVNAAIRALAILWGIASIALLLIPVIEAVSRS
jgi:hypothetical protein